MMCPALSSWTIVDAGTAHAMTTTCDAGVATFELSGLERPFDDPGRSYGETRDRDGYEVLVDKGHAKRVRKNPMDYFWSDLLNLPHQA